jgi:glucose/arabinose dehydrogenase
VLISVTSVLSAAVPPPAFLERPVATGMSFPTAMTFAPDGRLFVCLKAGELRVIENEVLLPTPFLSLLVDYSGERGLLGVAFDPNFAVNHFIYVYYTVPSPVHNRVSRFTANGNVVVPGSELVILDLNNLSGATNHNGGAIHFGPDGKLYVATGDNASSANAQSFGNLLGKILRINPDPANLIPTDNPYYNDPAVVGVNKAIWALGLRNPYTFAFQPGTGRMLINDVGQVSWEEINDGIAHSNYGWPICEGAVCGGPPPIDYRAPLYAYAHSGSPPTGCAIVGAAFYDPPAVQYPASYVGKYFFADLCAGFIRYVDPNAGPPIPSSTGFVTGLSQPVDLAISTNGNLHVLTYGANGGVFKYVFPSNAEKTFDFDKDGKSDIGVWRPAEGMWYVRQSVNGFIFGPQWGQAGDVLVPGDYDGDGATDAAVWRPAEGTWYVRRSSDSAMMVRFWGTNGDVPVPGDYDGDGKTDCAVFRPGTGVWHVLRSSNGAQMAQPFGFGTDVTAPGDYDGDGKTDFAVWRESDGTFYALRSSDGTLFARQFGAAGDKVVPGDYDNDGVIDTAVFRPGGGVWYLLRSGDFSFFAQAFGLGSDLLTPGEYDGDGKTDFGVWRPLTGVFYTLGSSNGGVTGQAWGSSIFNDVPIQSAYVR